MSKWVWQTERRFEGFAVTITHRAHAEVAGGGHVLYTFGPKVREVQEGFLVDVELNTERLQLRLRVKPQADLEQAKEEALRLYDEFEQILGVRD